ncbi:MAG TPA: inorganic phosphate transporter [Planctomycetota bacterium]|nr:inorganic phosphate transporter [Planctomycetota bacterium]
MDTGLIILGLTVLFALAFSLANGWNDSANAIATVVSTRVLSPWHAVLFGAGLNFVGALFFSEVAKTVGSKVINPELALPITFLAAVVVAPIWATLCTLWGLPISCSHSLFGGLIGAVLASVGLDGLRGEGITKIMIGVFVAPVVGLVLGYLIMLAVAWGFRRMKAAAASWLFGKLQIVSAGAMAFAHGTGDTQNPMGIIVGALVAYQIAHGGASDLVAGGGMHIPLWVRLSCAACMAVGTAIGGWSVIRTLGTRLAHLKPYQGFCAETAAATTIICNTLGGIPISTTHSITGAIMGVGAAKGVRAVKWGVGSKILFAWIFTFPACIAGGWLVFKGLRLLGLG